MRRKPAHVHRRDDRIVPGIHHAHDDDPGLVLIRQRPGTASGIVFETIEDELGVVNLIVRANIYEKYRQAARHAALLHAEGVVERQGQVVHLMVWKMFDLSHLLSGFSVPSRDFH